MKMNKIIQANLNFEILNNLYSDFVDVLPIILGTIFYIVISWLLLKFILFIVKKSLKFTKIDSLFENANDKNPLFGSSIKIKPTKIILAFIKWFLILILIIVGSDILGLTIVSNEVGKLVEYLPKIFSAVLIFFVGIYGAILLRKTIQSGLKAFDMNGSKAISMIVFYLVFVVVSVMALNQAGVDTEIITKNFFLIIGAFLAAFAIAFGLGSREVIFRLLLGFYSRKNFAIGKRIRFDDVEGVVLSINNISMVIKSDNNKKIVVPIKLIVNKKIEILD
ncbi:mechanosensitive ion channel [Joostella atrarenae]|uniref:Mechanosensitive ion channel n=2 Tax=Joostella atrarenae TaxID=679257 RepID=A0ABS9J5F7_9FLAO|nr:mechanosensitive ion channel [Joostella atrarenae]